MRFAVVTILVGLGAGLSGLAVKAALVGIQTAAGPFDTLGHTPPWWRIVVLTIAGLIAAVGWWTLRRWGPAVVTVQNSVAGRKMPAVSTAVNAGLQILIVGLGASIGRELAPRELSAGVAGWLSDKAGVGARERSILVACGAGAGLAAVYNVPLGGAVFALEILLAQINLAAVIPAVATAGVAALLVDLVISPTPVYTIPHLNVTPDLTIGAVLLGPVIGVLASGFVRLVRMTERIRPRSWWILLLMPITFALVGAVSIPFPQILGNGQTLAQSTFNPLVPLGLFAVLAVVKTATTAATIGSGAAGGTLTPSLAIGASVGAALGGLWVAAAPHDSVAAFAFLGAAAFLGSSMRAPFTAIVLLIELTNQGAVLLLPTILCVAGSVAASHLLSRIRVAGVEK
ncbi:MAG: chloride channel protein [Microbacteriaceae bacterium]|nr:chloride channel protein [Microbacteriaceae bacterium]